MPDVFAHAPDKPTDNESLATAIAISDPTKSWAIYAELVRINIRKSVALLLWSLLTLNYNIEGVDRNLLQGVVEEPCLHEDKNIRLL